MSNFSEYIHYRALAYKYDLLKNDDLQRKMDHLIDAFPEGGPTLDGFKVPEVKNVCAKLAVDLSDHLDNTVAKLNMSKRQFIEMALIEALEHADHLIECVGAEDDL